MTITTIGAEPFMKLLNNLQNEYVEPIHAALEAFLASPVFAPVAALQEQYEKLRQLASYDEAEALYLQIEKEAAKLGAFNVVGREVRVEECLFDEALAQVEIELHPANCLLVEVKDYRDPREPALLYSQAFEVPHQFYMLVRKYCFRMSKRDYCSKSQLNMFVPSVEEGIRKTGIELCEYDRLAKLKALAQVLAA